MAEGCADLKQLSQESKGSVECAVCLQTCIHPAMLPCGHIFCFLCIKGIANQSRRCAMCRQEIPRDYLDHPKLLEPVDPSNKTSGDDTEDDYQWFYEGRNGWWQYDERTSIELEIAYRKGDRTCELLIAGLLYVADFDSMLQMRRNDPSRVRRIKRDLRTIAKKGIAGLRLDQESMYLLREPSSINTDIENESNDYENNSRSNSSNDSDVFEISTSENDSSIHEVSQLDIGRFSLLSLRDNTNR